MKNRAESDQPRSMAHRIVTAVFGVFLVLLAIGIVLASDASMPVGAVVAALALGVLGVDACVSAIRSKRSLLERIGPLP